MMPAFARREDDDVPSREGLRFSADPALKPKPRPERQGRARRLGVVLIADDTADARDLYALYLTNLGFTVITVGDGEAAIEAALDRRPDAIVMDLSMPRIDGITATQTLKRDARTRNTPIILLTGYPQRAVERGALQAGVDVFLTKPCLPEDLESHLQRLLEGGGTK
jgi:two-component system, cell cycle response regulator DivK